MKKRHYLIFVSLIITLFSCKKNQEHLIPKEVGEDIYLITSDLQSILYSQALLDRFALEQFSFTTNCLNFTSDTTGNTVTHVFEFQKSGYCDFYQDSTKGTISMSYNLNYGSILDTVFLTYQNFRSNGHLYNGNVKVLFTSFANFNGYDIQLIIDELAVSYKEKSYNINGMFTRSFYDKIYHTTGDLTAFLDEKAIQAKIKTTLKSDGDYTYNNYVFNNYFDSGVLEIPLSDHTYLIHYGVNNSYSDKAVCIDETGYRYIFKMNFL